VLEGGDSELGHWHLANSLVFIRNAHSLANLERLTKEINAKIL
jgi:hypothetical protein